MKSELKRSIGSKLVFVGVIGGVLILGFAALFLAGRVSWLPYTFPASVTSTSDEVVVPVPSDAINGTQWRVATTLGSSPATDVSLLKVTRYLSTTTVNYGEEIMVAGNRYRYMGLIKLTESSSAVVLKRR